MGDTALTIRVPDEILEQVRRLAKNDNLSLNKCIVGILIAATEGREIPLTVIERINQRLDDLEKRAASIGHKPTKVAKSSTPPPGHF